MILGSYIQKVRKPVIRHGQWEDCVFHVEVHGELGSATVHSIHIIKTLLCYLLRTKNVFDSKCQPHTTSV